MYLIFDRSLPKQQDRRKVQKVSSGSYVVFKDEFLLHYTYYVIILWPEGAPPLAFKTWWGHNQWSQNRGGGRLSPTYYYWHPNVFQFSATLHKVLYTVGIRGLPPWLDKIQGGSQNLMWNSLHVLNPHTYLCSM